MIEFTEWGDGIMIHHSGTAVACLCWDEILCLLAFVSERNNTGKPYDVAEQIVRAIVNNSLDLEAAANAIRTLEVGAAQSVIEGWVDAR